MAVLRSGEGYASTYAREEWGGLERKKGKEVWDGTSAGGFIEFQGRAPDWPISGLRQLELVFPKTQLQLELLGPRDGHRNACTVLLLVVYMMTLSFTQLIRLFVLRR